MKITAFKEGDFITRTARTDVKFGGTMHTIGPVREPMGDGSYIGDKLLFLGVEAGSIWYKSQYIFPNRISSLSMSDWDDDHWDYYPEGKIKEWEKKYSQNKTTPTQLKEAE